ncbi:MAG TPA: hypothetical protein VJ892_00220 [Candidatus Absconditabacterales bacterium]|nr:hypothetical protein [Candidatus Absconditabacterales bacterium]
MFVGFFAIGFLFTTVFAYTVPLGDALDRFYDNYKKNSEINELQGKAIVEDIYGKTLDIVKNDQMIPIFDAFDKTAESLNVKYECDLDTQDMVNILYFTNNNLKRDLKNNLMGFENPKREDMGSSCNKFNVCVFNPKGGKINNTVTLNQNCQSEVEKEFIQYYLNSYYVQTIGGGNKGSNLFYNFSLDDSSYDIMNDIHILAKILFEDVSQPQETRFYKMPDVDYDSSFVDPPISMDIDRFSPYNNFSSVTGTNNVSGENNAGGNGITQTGYTDFEDLIDPEISDFVASVNMEIGGNADSIVGGNQCTSGFTFEGMEGYTTGTDGSQNLTPAEYLSGILEDISQMSCDLDGVCQNWESSDCEDCVNEGGGNTDFEEIEALLNAAQQSSGDLDDMADELGCFQTCQTLPCNATSCDKLVCYAKCSCQMYESPTFDPVQNPGLTSVFKIKFCIVPVMENKMNKGKTVYNLASVLTEVYNVLQNLRNSGELAINVKTKEFLDSSLKENNFGEQLSFSINSTTKPPFSEESELTQTQEQIDYNTTLMEGILGFSKDPNLDQEKNKYVVMDDPCLYIVEKQISDGADQYQQNLANCREEKEEMLVTLPPMEDILKDQKTVLLDAEFENFLRLNRNFWFETKEMFSAFKESARVLSEK